MKRLIDWIRAEWTILFNAGSLVGTTAITSLFGVVFWWLAVRVLTQASVGLGSAAISAMMLLGEFGVFGLGTLLIGEIPQSKRVPTLIVTAALVAGVIALILGIGFAVLAPVLSANLSAFATNAGTVLLFGAGVSLTAMSMVIDQALVGLLRGELQLTRNVIMAASKLVILLLFGVFIVNRNGLTLYSAWALGIVVSFLALLPYALRSWQGLAAYRPDLGLLSRLRRSALIHHVLNIALRAPALLLPILVTALISPEKNAAFYIAWLMASFVFEIPQALTTVLYAVGSKHGSVWAQKLRFTIRLSVLAAIAANVVVFFFADFILSIFGKGYAQDAAWSLRLMTLGAFPIILEAHYIAISRIRGEVGRAVMILAPIAALEVIFAVIGANVAGLIGVSAGWLLGLSIEAFVTINVVRQAMQGTAQVNLQQEDRVETAAQTL